MQLQTNRVNFSNIFLQTFAERNKAMLATVDIVSNRLLFSSLKAILETVAKMMCNCSTTICIVCATICICCATIWSVLLRSVQQKRIKMLNLTKVIIYLLTYCNTEVKIAQNIYIHNKGRSLLLQH